MAFSTSSSIAYTHRRHSCFRVGTPAGLTSPMSGRRGGDKDTERVDTESERQRGWTQTARDREGGDRDRES